MSRTDQLSKMFSQNLHDHRNIRVDLPDQDPRLRGVSRDREAMLVEIDRVIRDPNQPREEFDDEALERLGRSLLERGQIQPIQVRWDGENYVIIVGERRWEAAKRVKLTTIRAIVRDEVPPEELLVLQLIENLLREDLKPLEQARAFQRLMDSRGWSQRRVADEVGVSGPTVVRALKLLELPETVQEAVESGDLSPSVAYEVSQSVDPETTARDVVKQKLNRNQTHALIRGEGTVTLRVNGYKFVVTGKLERRAMHAAWVKALDAWSKNKENKPPEETM